MFTIEPLPVGGHRLSSRLRDHPSAPQVYFHHLVPILEGRFQRRSGLGEAGVVHEDPQGAEFCFHLLDRTLNLFRIANVQFDRKRSRAACSEFFCKSQESVSAPGGQSHFRARPRQNSCEVSAEPARCACHQRHAPLQRKE
jgi:hypothetical protein